jgi:hypothetical protein
MKLSIQNMVVLSDAQNKKIIKKGKKSVNQMTTLSFQIPGLLIACHLIFL